jgi:hypothetical protein
MKDEETYRADPNVDPSGTSFHNQTVSATYDQLVAILGPHNCDGDSDKVTTEWTVKGPNGEVLTIYDWKETSVHDVRGWATIRWHIGAHEVIDAIWFRNWLDERI